MAKGQKLWSPSQTPTQVLAEMKRRAPSRAAVYGALTTHEFMSTPAIIKKLGKDPDNSSDVTGTLGFLNELRAQGLIISEKIEGAGKRGALKHKKCEHPMLIPQESPRAHMGGRKAKKKVAKKGATPSRAGTNGASASQESTDPLRRIIESAEALADLATQHLKTVRVEADRIARSGADVHGVRSEMEDMLKRMRNLENRLKVD